MTKLAKSAAVRMKPPRERYTLKPHEVRKLVEMAGRLGRAVNISDLKAFRTYFGGTVLKALIEALQKNGVLVDDQISGDHVDHAEPEKTAAQRPKRAKLTLYGAKTNPAPSAPQNDPSAPSASPDDLRQTRSELDMLRSRLSFLETTLKNRERELIRREAEAESDREEARQAIEEADRLAELRDAEIERLKLAGKSLPRNPDAEPVRLFSRGSVRQALLARDLKWTKVVAERDRQIEALRLELAAMRGEPIEGATPATVLLI